MARLKIRTIHEFLLEMEKVPAGKQVLTKIDEGWWPEVRKSAYAAWHQYLHATVHLIESRDWSQLRDLFRLYEGVERAGRRGEMFEGTYVAFVEDLRLPSDPREVANMLGAMGPALLAAVHRDQPQLREMKLPGNRRG